jgi:hypothetical protein
MANGYTLASSNISFQQEVLDKFNDRITEIELYFDLIDKIEAINPIKTIAVDQNISKITLDDFNVENGNSLHSLLQNILNKLDVKDFDFQISNIFKSNSILILYNLIESTISNSDKFFLRYISDLNLKFHELSPELKTFWIKHSSQFDKNNVLEIAVAILDKIQTITIDVSKQVESNSKEFQGNLDPRFIDQLLESYGIKTTKTVMLTDEDARTAVRNIVIWRNDLAHGKYSFAEFGQRLYCGNGSLNDVKVLKMHCFNLVTVFLKNIDEHIENEYYKIN